jgi:leucyl-tRNA synthetase
MLKHPTFYITKNKLELIKNSEDLSFIKDAYIRFNPTIEFEDIKFTYQKTESKGFSKIPIDVSLLNSDDSIDIGKFVKNSNVKHSVESVPEFILEDNEKLILVREIEKMSKSKYNVVTPDDIVEKFGADTLRLYEMFLGPLEQSKPWNTNGITGVSGFLKKLWRLFYNNNTAVNLSGVEGCMVTETEPTKAELKTLHKTIKKITEDIERFSFNTSVSNFMICVNELTDLKCNKRAILEPLLILISPYAPHITEELWQQLGHTESIAFEPFPMCNESYLVDDAFNYPISFNGKMRFQIELPTTLTVPEIEKEVMSREEVIKQLAGATPKKIIIVPKKIVNIVH